MSLRKLKCQLIKYRKRFVFLPLLFFLNNSLTGQKNSTESDPRNRAVDSLLLIIKNTDQDSIKLKALTDLAYRKYILVRSDARAEFEPALKYANEALLLAQKLNNKQQEGEANFIIAAILRTQGNFPEALKMFFIALKLSERAGDKQNIVDEYFQIACIHNEMGNFPEALKFHFSALKIREEIGWKRMIQLAYNMIGDTYYNEGNADEAMKYFLLGLKIASEQSDTWNIGLSYKGLGNVYMAKGNYPEAFKYLFTALEMLEHSKFYVSECYFSIGNVYLKKAAFANKTECKRNYNAALINLKKGLMMAKQSSFKNSILNAYSGLTVAYLGINDHKNALHYNLLYTQLKDSLFSTASFIKVAELKMQFETEKTEAIEKVKQEKVSEDRRRNNSLLMLAGSAFIIIFIFCSLLLRQRNLKKRALDKAETTHQLAELEMQSLRSQLNPHFMFNSLNSIQTLILKEDNDKSHSYLSRFARLLRMLLENADKPFIPLQKEIDFLQLYLSLESLRVPDLRYSVSVDPSINTVQTLIPNMILQPYVENAIWHGLSYKESDKQLQIRINRDNGVIKYEIEDNGVGRKKAEELKSTFRRQHESKGMELLSKRFKLLNGEYNSSIETAIIDVIKNNKVAGTLVTIKVPVQLSLPS